MWKAYVDLTAISAIEQKSAGSMLRGLCRNRRDSGIGLLMPFIVVSEQVDQEIKSLRRNSGSVWGVVTNLLASLFDELFRGERF
jgi:hypothetical protein